RRRTLTIFSKPVWLSLAARYSAPSPEVSISSSSTNFPNFSFLAMDGLSPVPDVVYEKIASRPTTVNKSAGGPPTRCVAHDTALQPGLHTQYFFALQVVDYWGLGDGMRCAAEGSGGHHGADGRDGSPGSRSRCKPRGGTPARGGRDRRHLRTPRTA